MPFLKKLKEIESHLSKIELVNSNIRSSGKFTSLENDLVKDHLRHLYELYDELRSVESVHKLSSEKLVEEIPVKKVEEAIMEVTADPADDAPSKLPEETSNDLETPSIDDNDELVSLFEKFKEEKDTPEVNAKSLTNKPLKEIIPLNDKFMFIKEFFDNSISKYDDMLEKIEGLGKKEGAIGYMKENVWSSEIFEKNEELVDRFISILESKFNDQ